MVQSKAFTDASHALNDLSHALALLESDNAKLRELVKGIYLNYAADGVAPFGMICEYASRMKELGIELD